MQSDEKQNAYIEETSVFLQIFLKFHIEHFKTQLGSGSGPFIRDSVLHMMPVTCITRLTSILSNFIKSIIEAHVCVNA